MSIDNFFTYIGLELVLTPLAAFFGNTVFFSTLGGNLCEHVTPNGNFAGRWSHEGDDDTGDGPQVSRLDRWVVLGQLQQVLMPRWKVGNCVTCKKTKKVSTQIMHDTHS
jgi:hypothetical protein